MGEQQCQFLKQSRKWKVRYGPKLTPAASRSFAASLPVFVPRDVGEEPLTRGFQAQSHPSPLQEGVR
jgi:hypothetical protein